MKSITALMLFSLVPVMGATASFDKNPWSPTIVAGCAAASLEQGSNPAPVDGDTCLTCNGTGEVGDGTVMFTCLDCDGTGKVKKQEPLEDLKLEPEASTEEPAKPKPSDITEEQCAPSATSSST